MNFFSIFLFTFSTLFGGALSQMRLLSHPKHSLQETHIDYSHNETSTCLCISKCRASTVCLGVTIAKLSDELFKCSVTTKLLMSMELQRNDEVNMYFLRSYCKPPRFYVGESCVLIVKEVSNTHQCPEDMVLYYPETRDELKWLKTYLLADTKVSEHFSYLIDLTNMNGVWTWGNGETHPGNTGRDFWWPGQPNNPDIETCATISVTSDNFGLDDFDCSWATTLLCKIPL